jgi:PhnB protein
MIEVSPVLIFNGNCEEAFSFYKSVFGGEYQFIYRYEDVPDNGAGNGYEKKILHVSLPLMKNVNLMGTDNMSPAKREAGGHVEIGLRLNDKDETFRLFEALSLGGSVVTPLGKTFYADYYGSVIDKFGVGWSFNCNIGREPAV